MKNRKLEVLVALSLMAFLGLSGCGAEKSEEKAAVEEKAPDAADSTAAQAHDTRGMAQIELAGKSVSINYGRPGLKGRDMLAKATDGIVWRMGNGKTTDIKFDGDVKFGNTVVKQGEYSLWMKKVGEGWELHLNTNIAGNGRAPEDGFVASVAMASSENSESIETFTIELSAEGSNGSLAAKWGTSVMTASFSAN